MKKIFLISVLCCIVTCFNAYSEENKNTEISVDKARSLYSLLENLEGQKSLFPEETDAQKLYELIDDKYKTEQIKLSEDESEITLQANVHLAVFKKSTVIRIFVWMYPKATVSKEECLSLLNDWNKDNIFQTAYLNGDKFELQYHLSFKGGIHADNLNDTLAWFYSMIYGFWEFMNKKGML